MRNTMKTLAVLVVVGTMVWLALGIVGSFQAALGSIGG